jgi:hypothetical protein
VVGRWRLLAVVAVLTAGGIAAAVFSGGPTKPSAKPSVAETDSERAGCKELPSKGTTPSWFPKDLPLPSGSYSSAKVETPAPGTNAAVFVADGNLDSFIAFATSRWTSTGWQLFGGDREADEAESNIRKGALAGHFRARSAYCEGDKTEVLFVFTKK